MKKITHISKALAVLDSIKAIDSGGCGIACLAMYLYLKRFNLHSNFSGIALADYRHDHESNLAYVKGDSSSGTVTNHFAFQIDEIKYRMEDKKYELTIDRNVEEYFTDLILNHSWNSWFNREKNCPIIEKKLRIKLPKGTY